MSLLTYCILISQDQETYNVEVGHGYFDTHRIYQRQKETGESTGPLPDELMRIAGRMGFGNFGKMTGITNHDK